MILQSLVASADTDDDGKMNWEEFESFGDFDLVFKKWIGRGHIRQENGWRTLIDVNLNKLEGSLSSCEFKRNKRECFPYSSGDHRKLLR